jgi:hypothetical protein
MQTKNSQCFLQISHLPIPQKIEAKSYKIPTNPGPIAVHDGKISCISIQKQSNFKPKIPLKNHTILDKKQCKSTKENPANPTE